MITRVTCPSTAAFSVRSLRFQNDIPISRGIAGADQANRMGHALFEVNVSLTGQRNLSEGFREAGDRLIGIAGNELVRLPDPAEWRGRGR